MNHSAKGTNRGLSRIAIPVALVCGCIALGPAAAQEEVFSEAGALTVEGDPSANRHVIPVEAGTPVEVIVIGEGIDTTLTATLPDGATISNDDYQDFNAGFMYTPQTDGEIVVVAAALSSGTTGSYRVVARTLPPAATIEIGETAEGRLSGGTESGNRYELSGAAGTRVVIDMKSYDLDSYLTVVDSAGNETTDDDGGDEGYNSRLSHRFESDGTVTIIAGQTGSSSGRYELSVTELAGEPAERITGSLTADSARAYDGTRYERHEVDAEAGQMLTVELKSNAFDPVLFISNPDGSNLVRDDDGGNGNNSMAVASLPYTGTYVIYVTGFGDATGSYELTIYR